ncbi:serine/threonine-protein kinase [Nocardia sp. 004]|uniref:serine/threonine-protein kinase n=1 Tax=Nocardia sp. 004 TaxID=3385978 RepID=UPI00399F2FF1
MALRPGTIVGGYRVLRTLGSGGMGTVYLAQNPILPRRDALKVLSADLSADAEFRARFEREANLAAGLDHPNIVAVYNRGEEAGRLWIAMQYIDGTDAAAETKRDADRMTPRRALRIVSEVGKGLDYAHRRGLLHRDVKPANFLLSAADDGDDDDERVLLTDFGVAKSSEDNQDLTATGNFVATVAYAPPEQLVGGSIDNRADIYSLGCSFYKLLTGQNPYPSPKPAVVMMGHLHEPPPKPSAVRSDLPAALDDVLAKAMAKDPADRYSTCREFTKAAAAALYGISQVRAPGPDPSADAPTQRTAYTDPRHAITAPFPGSAAQFPVHTPPHETDQHSLATARSSSTRPSRARRILVPALAALFVGIAVAVGTLVFVDRQSGSTVNGDQLAQVRSTYPQFEGKTVTAFHLGDATLSAVLHPSDQSEFLQGIGFRYSTKYKAIGDEESPRPLSANGYSANADSDVVIILRTDSEAGNGGLRGIPSLLLNSSTAVVVVDELSTVQAFQIWSEQSQELLINEMVPTIAKIVQ